MKTVGKQMIGWVLLAGLLSMAGCAAYKKDSYLVDSWERSHRKAGYKNSALPYVNALVMTIPACIADLFLFPGMALEAAGSAGAFDSAGEWAREEERKQQEREAINQAAAANYAASQGSGYNAAQHQRELDDKLEKQRVQGQIDAERRKDAAAKTAYQQKREQEKLAKEKKLRWKLDDETDALKKAWSDFEFKLVVAGRDLKKDEFPGLESEFRSLESEQKDLNKRLEKAGMATMSDRSNDVWFDINRRELKNREAGKRETLYGLHGPSGEDWSEHLVATIQGIHFYQRVRYRKWPDPAVDVSWRVENTTSHPYWHSLTEFKTNTHPLHYLWGGGTLKPGASYSHVYVSYAKDRTNWNFEGFVRRED